MVSFVSTHVAKELSGQYLNVMLTFLYLKLKCAFVKQNKYVLCVLNEAKYVHTTKTIKLLCHNFWINLYFAVLIQVNNNK